MAKNQIQVAVVAAPKLIRLCDARLCHELLQALQFAIVKNYNPTTVFLWRSDGIYARSSFLFEYLTWTGAIPSQPPYPYRLFKQAGVIGAVLGKVA